MPRKIPDVHFLCKDCRKDTLRSDLDYYMVTDKVWAEAKAPKKGMLCLFCLSARLGRRLNFFDFSDAPINDFLRGTFAHAEEMLYLTSVLDLETVPI